MVHISEGREIGMKVKQEEPQENFLKNPKYRTKCMIKG